MYSFKIGKILGGNKILSFTSFQFLLEDFQCFSAVSDSLIICHSSNHYHQIQASPSSIPLTPSFATLNFFKTLSSMFKNVVSRQLRTARPHWIHIANFFARGSANSSLSSQFVVNLFRRSSNRRLMNSREAQFAIYVSLVFLWPKD